jgi:type II secretory pathway component PulF
MMIDIGVVWLIYIFAVLLFFGCFWKLTSFFNNDWLKLLLRFPLLGLLLTPMQLSFSELVESFYYAPAIIVAALSILDRSIIHSWDVLICLFVGVWFSLIFGVLGLYLSQKSQC